MSKPPPCNLKTGAPSATCARCGYSVGPGASAFARVLVLRCGPDGRRPAARSPVVERVWTAEASAGDVMSCRSDLVDVEVVKRRETELAWGFASPDDPHEIIWFPKSQGELEMTSPQPRPHWTLTCPEWIAKDKRLI